MRTVIHILLWISAITMVVTSHAIASTKIAGPIAISHDSITSKIMALDTIPGNDSVTRILPGVEVEAERYYYKANKAVYRPTRKEKNASTDAIDLLRRMQIPQLDATPSGVTTFGGQELSYFVNGHPASQEELKGMFMKDVKSVEYIENPSDPQYLGASYVVNFIVQEYEYGGFTKLSLDDYFIKTVSNQELLFSRFSYGRMTYDLSTSFKNYSNHHSMTRSEEIFNPGPNSIVRRSSPLSSNSKWISFPIKLRAAYSHGKTYLTNTFGFKFVDYDENESIGDISYNNDTDKDYSYLSSGPSKTVSATWDGYLSQTLGNGWSLSSEDYLYYTHMNVNDLYKTSMPLEINNIMREDAFNARLNLNIRKKINSRHSVFAMAQGNLHTSRIHYEGSSQTDNSFRKWSASMRVGYQYNHGNLSANTYIGVGYERNKDNDFVVSSAYPFGILSLNYNPNQRHSFSFWSQYSTFSCGADMQNPTLVRRNDLMYLKGNPELDPFGRLEISGKYYWTPIPRKLYFASGFGFEDRFKRYITIYERMPDSDAVLMTYDNMGDAKYSFLNLSLNWNAIGHKLMLCVKQYVRLYRPSESYLPDINYRYGYYSIDSYLGDFSLSLELWDYGRYYSSTLMDEVIKRRPFYKFSAGWGNGNWTLTLSLINIFNTSWKGNQSFVYSPAYIAHDTKFGNDIRQTIRLQASYTFSYGKKIKRGNQLNSDVSASGSAIIR